MTKDDIIRMAREVGLQPYYDEQETAIEAFANLVAKHEREECAKLFEPAICEAQRVCAKAIRARSDK